MDVAYRVQCTQTVSVSTVAAFVAAEEPTLLVERQGIDTGISEARCSRPYQARLGCCRQYFRHHPFQDPLTCFTSYDVRQDFVGDVSDAKALQPFPGLLMNSLILSCVGRCPPWYRVQTALSAMSCSPILGRLWPKRHEGSVERASERTKERRFGRRRWPKCRRKPNRSRHTALPIQNYKKKKHFFFFSISFHCYQSFRRQFWLCQFCRHNNKNNKRQYVGSAHCESSIITAI